MAGEQRMCQWPEGCDLPARPKADPSTPGKHPIYCFQFGHTPVNAKRLRNKLEGEDRSHGLPPGRAKRVNGIMVHASGAGEFRTDSPRLVALITGELDVNDLDDEELARGYPKDKNGRFTGRPPRMIPMALHQRIQKEFFARIEEKMRDALPDAVAMLAQLATSPAAEDKDKLKAIDMLMNRVMGKPPERVEISSGDKPFEMTMGRMRRAPAKEPEEADSGE